MSPRSEEFLLRSRERLAAANDALRDGHLSTAVSEAYYGALYAVRAALSEEDLHAKTHSGAWNRFHETFVATGRFDAGLLAEVRELQRHREGVDYDAATVPPEEAQRIVELAGRFVEAVAAMLRG